jgi:indole-3-acetate monooxygenase
VVEAAEALAPRVAELAELGERERRLPPELVDKFRSAGLLAMCAPASLGGGEVPLADVLTAVETIAVADAAAAWCAMIQSTSGVTGGYLEPEGAAEVFANGRDTVLGGVYAPLGRAADAPGGYRVSGRWPFASGSAHCTWLIGGSLVEAGPPRLMLFPAAEVTIHDTWHVSGLAGTGSHDFEVRDVFVPRARTVAVATEQPLASGPLYRFPVFGLLALGIAAVALGIARGAIDDILDLAGAGGVGRAQASPSTADRGVHPPSGKTPTGSRRKLAERPLVQLQLAQAEAGLGSSRAYVFDSVGRAWAAAERGEVLTLAQRARLRLAATSATLACAQVVDAMYGAGGGTSIYQSSPLQRRFRDIHAATQHVMVGLPTYELAGRVLLGLETDTSVL